MEESSNIFAWWWANKAALASSVLFLASLLTIAFPLYAQRRLPKVSLGALTAQHPRLRWLKWGGPAVAWGSWIPVVAGIACLHERSARLGDDQGTFLLAAILCIPPAGAAALAAATGVYREIVGRGRRPGHYYCVAGTALGWVPWAQCVAALAVAALSLAGFFMTAPR